jgi:hypothetical protein
MPKKSFSTLQAGTSFALFNAKEAPLLSPFSSLEKAAFFVAQKAAVFNAKKSFSTLQGSTSFALFNAKEAALLSPFSLLEKAVFFVAPKATVFNAKEVLFYTARKHLFCPFQCQRSTSIVSVFVARKGTDFCHSKSHRFCKSHHIRRSRNVILTVRGIGGCRSSSC